MKAPKINKYQDGGTPKYATKKMTAKEWEAENVKAGRMPYPGSALGREGHGQYYDPSKYKVEKDESTGLYGSTKLDPKALDTIELYTYDYSAPKAAPVVKSVPSPAVPEGHKPLVIGTAGTYDPNTETTYIDPSKKTGTIEPIVKQYAKGGYIPKSMLLKKKGLANGGDVTPEEEARGFYSQNGVKYNASGQPVMDSSTFSTQGAGGEALSGNTMPLTSGTEFKTSGDAASTGTTNPTTTGTEGGAAKKQNGNLGGKLGASMGWMQYANAGKDFGKSLIAKETITDPATGEQTSYAKDRTGAGIDKALTPYHEQYAESIKKGDYAPIAAQLIGGPAGQIAYEGLIGEKKDKAEFEKKKAQYKATTETAQNLGARNERSALAQGGTIKGPGTGKSDSILSKIGNKGLPSGSFIVPAENNGLAKKLREKFLGDNPDKVAKFKKGGEAESDVAVSNGEHLFTPKEKEKITAYLGKEILEKLAPEAEEHEGKMHGHDMTEEEHKEMMEMDMDHKAKGGELSSHKAKIMLHEGKFDSDKQRRYFGWVAGGRKACGGTIKKAHGGDLKAPMVKYADGTPPEGVDPKLAEDFKASKKESDLKEREALLKEYKSLKDKNDDIAKFRIKQIAGRVGEIEKRYPETKAPVKSAESLSKLEDTKPLQLGSPKKAPKVGAAMTAKKQAQLMSEMGTIEPKAAPSMTSQIETQDATLKTPSVNIKEKETITETPTKEGSKWYSGLGSAVEPLAVAGQVGMGLRSLNKAGKLPVDKIDPVFQANVDKAQAAAKFGFTPEQQFSIDQDRQNALNAARFAARNYSGGNAGAAFSQERAAINEGWGRGLKAKIANQELMMDKQKYADTMALQKAGMSRQLFEDKMNAWNQQQQAGSQLLGAGIRNAIGASRYAKELEAQKQRQQYYNG